jgi:Erythronolide synthase docking domain/Beta-ketoacyl synthase, N-terminal domain
VVTVEPDSRASQADKLREYLKRATIDVRRLQRELREERERAHEPIAIVGIGCRFVGGIDSPEALWDLLERGGEVQVKPYDHAVVCTKGVIGK